MISFTTDDRFVTIHVGGRVRGDVGGILGERGLLGRMGDVGGTGDVGERGALGGRRDGGMGGRWDDEGTTTSLHTLY